MAFNQKVVYGLCNVLNRHAKYIDLKAARSKNNQRFVEYWAKRMDLTYRDNINNWQMLLSNPWQVIETLERIERLHYELQLDLYKIDGSLAKQLSKRMPTSDFLTVRRQFRENFEILKLPLKNLKKLFLDTNQQIVDLKPIAAVQVSLESWLTLKNKKRIPKTLSKNIIFKNFLKDCLEVFEVQEEAGKAYGEWYQFTQKAS
ncbi:MAG: hypothetical protein VYE27_07715 [Pseudomonadota bacterium]|nr:hypothetical protein [Pseudomonadota bacterium]